MLTIEQLMGLASLCLAIYELGYQHGKNNNEHKNNRPSAKK